MEVTEFYNNYNNKYKAGRKWHSINTSINPTLNILADKSKSKKDIRKKGEKKSISNCNNHSKNSQNPILKKRKRATYYDYLKYIERQQKRLSKNNLNEDKNDNCPELIPIENRYNEVFKKICKINNINKIKSHKKKNTGNLFSLLSPYKVQVKPNIFHVQNKTIQKAKLIRKKLFIGKTFNWDQKLFFNINNIFDKLLVEKNPFLTLTNESNEQQLNSKFYSSVNSKQLLVLLKNEMHIYGTIKLTLIAGSVDIFGYVPNINEILEIYSPKRFGYLSITPRRGNKQIDLKEKLQKYADGFLTSELNEILNNFNPLYETILLLEKNYAAKKIKIIEKYVEENLFPNMNSMRIDRSYYVSEFILRSIIYKECDNKLIIDPKWKMIQLKKNCKLMIIGGKSVGKSTCLRYIVNKELKNHKKILLIDLDIGQPEIYLPQTISATIVDRPLLGPGYFFNLYPTKAILYGDNTVSCNPKRYLQNIKELSRYCSENKELSSMPWIINTMGYNKGFGSELIAVLCHFLRPTEVLQLQSSNPFNNFNFLMKKEVLQNIPLNIFKNENLSLETNEGSIKYLENLNFNFVVLNSILTTKSEQSKDEKNLRNFHSKNNRYLVLISKLDRILKNKYDFFTDVKPICCCLDDVKLKLFGYDILSERQFLDLVDANVVYMCHFKDENSSLECHGIGIVRGVDKLHRKIYLISSVTMEIVKHVNCLSICNISLPKSLFLNQGPKIKGSVPYTYNTKECDASKPIKFFMKSTF